MATNRVFNGIDGLSVVCSHPTTPASGDPVRVGTMAGVALTDERADGTTSVDFDAHVYDLLVDDNAATGIAVGAKLYYHDTATGTPATSVNNSSASADAFVGYALEVVGANATTVIQVRVAHG